MPGKRKRVSTTRAVSTAMKVGNWGSLARASRMRQGWKRNLRGRLSLAYMNQRIAPLAGRVNKLYKMIETKQITRRTSDNVNLAHNNVHIVQDQIGGPLNMFRSANSTDDPMGVGGSRIGDQIAVKGVKLTCFLENALGRPKVHYRLMLVKMAKGDTLDRSTLFQNKTNNKMIDTINTERYTILFQRRFNMTPSNGMATSLIAPAVPGAGEPLWAGDQARPGTATRIVTAWIPGRKLFRNGILQFENNSNTQTKFFDYRWVILAYDWFGTPQDVNNVGKINELFTTVYFKDA